MLIGGVKYADMSEQPGSGEVNEHKHKYNEPTHDYMKGQISAMREQIAILKEESREKDHTIWELEAKITGLVSELRRLNEAIAGGQNIANAG